MPSNSASKTIVGGLVGMNAGGVVQSYVTGRVSGASSQIGGLAGYNQGAINLSYSTAVVSGYAAIGGLAGTNFGTMNQVYATGAVSGTNYTGGLVGNNGGNIAASYFDTDTTGKSSGDGGGNNVGITGLTTVQARTAASYSAWDFANTWYQSGDMRPILRSEAATADVNGIVTISNLHQLALMGASLTGSYRLASDIDASTTLGTNAADIWSTSGWVPVGGNSAAFTGNFDGQGHTISGLTVNRAASFLGLFGNSSGTIQNIGLISEFINGYSYAGGLVGNNTGTISSAYASGTVNGMQYVGGLTGWNSGSVSNSYASTATYGTFDVGGLVGHNHGSISNSYATGATVGSNTYAGGLVGFNDSTIKFAYAVGSVVGNTYVGGLVGYNDSGSSIDNAYASGAVNGSNVVGGLVGRNAYSTITNSFWDVSTTGRSSGYGQSFSGTFSAIGLTTAQMRDSANKATNYTGWDFGGIWYQAGDMRPILRSEAATADANGVIAINNLHQLALIGINFAGHYTLANNIDASETSGAHTSGIWSTNGWVPLGDGYHTTFSGAFDGNGHTISGLIVGGDSFVGLFGASRGSISNVGLIGGSVTGISFQVGALVGMSSGSISNSYSTATVSGGYEVGGLVGQNYGSISNSYSTATVSGDSQVGGLAGQNFGSIDSSFSTGAASGVQAAGGLVGQNEYGGTITNSYAIGAVSGSRVGGLVGYNSGTISNTYARGTVTGSDMVGGLVGENYLGTISNAYASGAVSGGMYVGGLVGQNDLESTISNSYATGAVSDGTFMGGLVGVNVAGARISSAYASGAVSSGGYAGGLVAANAGTVTASFWDTEATGQTSGTSSGSSTGMTGLTSAQMADPFSFINAGWDFANVWGKSTSGANNGFMMLRSLSSGLYDDYVKIGSGTRIYGDANSTFSSDLAASCVIEPNTSLGSMCLPTITAAASRKTSRR